MKRSIQLHKLSSDHHLALRIAKQAKKAVQSNDMQRMATLQAEIIQSFHDTLEPHFKLEEQYLAEPLKELGEEALLAQFYREHQQLREWVEHQHEPLTFLVNFGELLERHVRFEERQFFEVAQQRLDQEVLNKLQQACLK
ncbi:MAG: hypothetical protein L3J28_14005 [Candidatus Polarisedimenticolaceae bacterium]|nr:hypothetical protein [Candidatus Polarisedimenticolaceae bacterium]